MHFTLPPMAGQLLLDRGSAQNEPGATYPFSVQNVMWIVFFASLGELVVRYFGARIEEEQLKLGFLPEDSTTMLSAMERGNIFAAVSESRNADTCFLPRLIRRSIMQYETTKSIEHASSTVVANADIYLHEIDLKYNLLRYMMWLIPSLGFIGTVVGISLALAYAGQPGRIEDPLLLTNVTQKLAVAFNTTLLALILSAVLVYLSGMVQTREERSLNRTSQYCLDNLVARLFAA